MLNRSADAAIRGYGYQFLHTVKDILENENDTNVNTIEGIEDLDIETSDKTKLIQYKYHEEQSYTNSKIAKPIALMFKHFKNNGERYNYKLFIFLNDSSLPELTKDKVIEILKIQEARKILSDTDTELTLENIDYYSDDIERFVEYFSWRLTNKYEELEDDVVNIFETNLGISSEESKIIYLSNALKIINDLAKQQDVNSRKITKREFLSKLNSYKKRLYSAYLLREKGFNKLKTIIKQQKNAENIKPNTSTHIVYIGNDNRENIHSLMIDLVKKFCFKDKKHDYKPIVFIVKSSNYSNFKKLLFEKVGNDNIKVNDGTEDYFFNKTIFNNKPIIVKNRAGNKINKVEYNFKIISKDNYDRYKNDIDFANPVIFILDSDESDLFSNIEKRFYFNQLENNQILQLIGG